MVTDSQKDPSTEKEIDLLEVSGNIFSSIKNGISSLFSSLWKCAKILFFISARLLNLGIKNWLFFIIAGVIAAGSSYALYISSKPYYNLDGYGVSRLVANQEIIQIINSLSIPNDLNPIDLANDLNLAPEVYNDILSIKASWLIDLNSDGISDYVDYDNDFVINSKSKDSLAVRMTDRFNVRIVAKNPSISLKVQEALLTYLSNHSYIKDLNTSRIEKSKEMMNIYEQQVTILDSLQHYEYFIEEQENDLNQFGGFKFGDFEIKGSAVEKRLYHTDIISLKENAVNSKANMLYNTEPVIFIGNITTNAKRVNNLVFYTIKVLFIIFPLMLLVFGVYKRKDFSTIFSDIQNKINAYKQQ